MIYYWWNFMAHRGYNVTCWIWFQLKNFLLNFLCLLGLGFKGNLESIYVYFPIKKWHLHTWKITCYLHMWKDQCCYAYIINCAFLVLKNCKWVKYFSALEEKFCISMWPCNILSICNNNCERIFYAQQSASKKKIA